MGDSRGRKANEQTLVKTIVVLIRNTTWRCGKLEKSIVRHLYKRHENFGKPGVSVKEIMVKKVITILPDADIKEAGRIVLEKKIGCLPVVGNDKLVGLVTETDILQQFISGSDSRP